MKIINSEDIPIKIWTDEIEPGALEQAKNLANFPFTFHHIAIMPDVHTGFGMPIGGILATKNVVIPNAVGVDIGCGIIAVKISLKIDDLSIDLLKKIIGQIRQIVPVGFKKHKIPKGKMFNEFTPKGVPRNIFQKKMFTGGKNKIVNQEFESAKNQLGTLGGGNHFIEFQKDEKNNIWIMIHSGSRNLGFKVAKYYNEVAKELNKNYEIKIPEKWDLNYLFVVWPTSQTVKWWDSLRSLV
ncbi:MAG: RtcB family protein, partial [Nanoarchaeota archaeon]